MLPEELKSKVFLYLSHPVADLADDEHDNKLVDLYNDLIDFFPELTFDDILETSEYGEDTGEHQQVSFFLYDSSYREVYHLLHAMCIDKCEEQNATFTFDRFFNACCCVRKCILNDLPSVNHAIHRLMYSEIRVTSGPPQNPVTASL